MTRSNIKKVICICAVLALCFSMMPVMAFAKEQSTTITPYGAGQGHIIYPTSTQLTITGGSVDYVKYTGTYGLFGKEGVIVLKFTNTTTGDFKSITFICDNSYYQRQLPISLPAGTYTVTCEANTVTNFYNISINFG